MNLTLLAALVLLGASVTLGVSSSDEVAPAESEVLSNDPEIDEAEDFDDALNLLARRSVINQAKARMNWGSDEEANGAPRGKMPLISGARKSGNQGSPLMQFRRIARRRGNTKNYAAYRAYF